jgi:hypothetical protein
MQAKKVSFIRKGMHETFLTGMNAFIEKLIKSVVCAG